MAATWIHYTSFGPSFKASRSRPLICSMPATRCSFSLRSRN